MLLKLAIAMVVQSVISWGRIVSTRWNMPVLQVQFEEIDFCAVFMPFGDRSFGLR